jgi:hypothetical protein
MDSDCRIEKPSGERIALQMCQTWVESVSRGCLLPTSFRVLLSAVLLLHHL